jgi:hypothetical protein
MPVFDHAIQESGFDDNQHKGQCKCIADPVCNGELHSVVVLRKRYKVGF